MDNSNNNEIGVQLRGPKTLIEHVKSIRSLALAWESSILGLKTLPEFKNDQSESQNHSEAIANIMLAYRHVEDARMRLGKVIQAMDGGVSIYDKQN